MSLSTLPLSYCSNVHPAQSVAELLEVLAGPVAQIAGQTGFPIAAGLWLADNITREIDADPAQLAAIQERLQANGLLCYTLNAFPFGNFHSERVKEQVYLPDWTEQSRKDYSISCGNILAELLADGVEGSISTVPLGFRSLVSSESFVDDCCCNLIEVAQAFDEIHDRTGRVIRLAIEPEPLCYLETTPQMIEFFDQLRDRAGAQLDVVERHIGMCYDVCHQAVEFEDVAESIRSIDEAGIRINKLHISCAIELKDPANNQAGREFLANYAEPRYLHQTFRPAGGAPESVVDLESGFALDPPSEWLQDDCWRIHFHVPIQAQQIGPLHTTRPDLEVAVKAVHELAYAPHLEVETYTWSVMPGEQQPTVCEGLTEELKFAHGLLEATRAE